MTYSSQSFFYTDGANRARNLERFFWGGFIFSSSAATAWYQTINSIVWLLVDISMILWVIVHPERFLNVLVANWPLLLCSVWASLSVCWSIEPQATLYQSVQLFLTMLSGFVLSERLELEQFVKIIFCVETIALLLSIAISLLHIELYNDSIQMFRGIFPHKNILSINMIILASSSICLFLAGWHKVSTFLITFVALFVVIQAGSGTSAVCSVVMIGFYAIYISVKKYSLLTNIIFICVIAIISILLVSTTDSSAGSFSIADTFFSILGKDKSLTGRSILWSYGWQTFVDHFIIGVGYNAYTSSLQSSFVIAEYALSQKLPYLHNNYLEVAVGLGIVGVVLFFTSILYLTLYALKLAVSSNNPIAAWPACYLFLILVYGGAENPLYYNHSVYETIFAAVTAFCIKKYIFVSGK